ncbi:vWA domain-containing protein [Vibrio tapetis]|nr:VWA domain-containing protein [Vibrio tapetis]
MFDFTTWELIVKQFHFLRPQWFGLLIPLAVLVRLRWKKDTEKVGHDLLPEHLRTALVLTEQGWQSQLPLKVLTVSFFLGITVCAGPTWQHIPSPFGEDKAELMIVLDTSKSMLETDVAPNRLARAKHKIQSLVDLRKGGKTGLIVYAGSAHTAMPLTTDKAVFLPYLAAITPEVMPQPGKQANSVLPQLSLAFSTDKSQHGNTVLLVTDAVAPEDIQDYQEYFSQTDTQLLILAAGNRERVSNSPLDMRSLHSLASKTGGNLIEMSIDGRDVERITQLVDTHMQLNGESDMPWQDMGYYLLFPVAFILLFWFRKGWLVQWAVVGLALGNLTFSPPVLAQESNLGGVQFQHSDLRVENQKIQTDALTTEKVGRFSVITSWWMDLWLTPDQQGQRLFNNKAYLAAAQHYQDPMRKGIAYYYAAEYELAYMTFMQSEDKELAIYNAASAMARQREYLAAQDLLIYLLEELKPTPSLSTKAHQNLAVIDHIVEQIERTSESQANTTEGLEESMELGDNPQTSKGYEEKVVSSVLLREKLNAEEILGSKALADKWLKRVEADPTHFLMAKFQIQLQNRAGEERDHGIN